MILQLFKNFPKSLLLANCSRNISVSAPRNVKEIIETKEGNVTTIEAFIKPHPREHLMLKNDTKACCMCAAGVDVKHTDVLILKQFVRSDGCMLPRRITKLCYVQQKRVGILVAMARKAGLMPNLAPEGSKMDPKKRWKWKKYNTYYDEDTIKQRYY